MSPFLHLLSFCSRFVNSTSLAVNVKSYFILSFYRPVTFVGVFDAPFDLADEAIIIRLEDFYGCQAVNTYRNCHQGTKIPNGVRTFSTILNGHLTIWALSSSFVLSRSGTDVP